jgi:hypothetical protein
MSATTVTLDGGLLTVLTGAVIPLLVSLVTKRVTKSSVQTSLLMGLSLLGGALTSIIADGGSFDPKNVLINIAVCFATGQTTYSRVYKPLGVSKKLQETGGLITAADPEKIKALEGKPADAEPAGEVLDDEQVVAVDGGDPELEGLEGDAGVEPEPGLEGVHGLMGTPLPPAGTDLYAKALEARVEALVQQVQVMTEELGRLNEKLESLEALLIEERNRGAEERDRSAAERDRSATEREDTAVRTETRVAAAEAAPAKRPAKKAPRKRPAP